MFGIRKLKEKFSELKSLVEKTVLRSQSHDSVILGIKGQVDQLRNDMAAEFVKRDKVIEGWAEDLGNLGKHLKDIEEYVSMQTDVVAAIILACGLREDGKLGKAYGQIQRERENLSQIIAKARAKNKFEVQAPEAEPVLKAEETLFAELNKESGKWYPFQDAKRLIGYKSHCDIAEFAKRTGLMYRKSESGHRYEVYVEAEKIKERPQPPKPVARKRIRSKYYKTVQAFIRTAQKDGFTAEEYRSAMDAVHAIPFENNGSKKLTTSDHDCVMKYLKTLKR